ncbi:sigma-70 family RNA polymerase sigma factor [Gallaecimonas sp. GXIMD4217]|uniref:RNA polymerase sigma factor n=1 Tax=Gallaecimonas sp. GXIMD4217 TaxID=3131927 RepID=UPI00311AF952
MLDKALLNSLYRYAYALCGNGDDAFDLLQGALERYLHQGPKGDGEPAYLRRIIRNRFFDRYRQQQRQREQPLEAALDLGTRALEQGLIEQEQLDLLWQTLSPQERELLYLWAYLEFTTEEIAQTLACPRGTVCSRIHRLRQKLARSDVTLGGEAP